ncbi:hypothetical protein LJC32_07050 [Oscillospiraceae bacterium OttesenSCG-928-F05]|nr:hypothetical protein [Oscillospiraceae bacterium OttesenSCG-928-F05]
MNLYHIPANFTDAGKLFGLFAVRNTLEALIISLPLLLILLVSLPFSITVNIVITLVVVIPAGGFALIGIGDDCLTRFVRIWWQYRKHRKIITYRGGGMI